MNQILTFQLDRISLNAGVPENSGISRNASISEDFEAHGSPAVFIEQFARAGKSKSVRDSSGKANPY